MKQFAPFALPCKASALRGKLKHSYLENAVCLPSLPDDLMESLEFKERGSARYEVIRQLIRDFTDLMGNLEQGFSPAQLVDRLHPFRDLSEEQRHSLKTELHANFIQEFHLAERKQRFEKVALAFVAGLDLFLGAPPGDANLAQLRMAQIQDSARALIRELEGFPKGIWLWNSVKNRTMKP